MTGIPQPEPSAPADEDPAIADLLSAPVIAIVPAARLEIALHLLATHGMRHLPVMDGARCIGVLCDTDIAHLMAYASAPARVPPLRVADLCRAAPVVTPQDRRSTAAARMQEMNIDVALVMTDRGLVGIVTSTDIVRSIAVRAPQPSGHGQTPPAQDVGPADPGPAPLAPGGSRART